MGAGGQGPSQILDNKGKEIQLDIRIVIFYIYYYYFNNPGKYELMRSV